MQTSPSTGKLTVYVNSPDGYLYALDAATGAVVWKAVVGIPSTTKNDYYAWGSPLVSNGEVYIGISSNCDSPLVPGGVIAVDQASGATIATWNSVPAGQVGGSVWSSAAELSDGSIVVTTGNANTAKQPLYNDSVVQLSGSNLNVLSAWQVPTSERIADGDFGASPTLFTATVNGVSTPMIGACNKNGIYYAFRQSDIGAGPLWETRITNPYSGGAPQCDAAATWDGTNLVEAGGQTTTIGGTSYPGSIQSLNPATGQPIWQIGLDGDILGSPTEDGAGVIAAPVYYSPSGNLGVYLINAATGAILGFIPTNQSQLFSQPIFVGQDLLVSGKSSIGITAYEVPVPGPTVSAVSPKILHQNSVQTLTITGSGFVDDPTVFVSNTNVTVKNVTFVNSSTLQVSVSTSANALLGSRDVVVVDPGPTVGVCSACVTVGPPPPTVSSISPSTLGQGERQDGTINGANLQPGATVSVTTGVQAQVTSLSSSQLAVTLTVGPQVALGTYNVTITNPDGGVGICKKCFTISGAGQPSVSGVSPGALGQHSTEDVLINGTNFTTTPTVEFSNSGIKVWKIVQDQSSQLEVLITVTQTAPLTPSDVSVTTASGTGTCPACLAIDAHPVIHQVVGSLVPGLSTTVTVSGANFQSGLMVSTGIPGATVGSITSLSQTSFSLSVSVPSATTGGTYSIQVTNPDGGTESANDLAVS